MTDKEQEELERFDEWCWRVETKSRLAAFFESPRFMKAVAISLLVILIVLAVLIAAKWF